MMNTLVMQFGNSAVLGVPHVRATKHDKEDSSGLDNLAKDYQHPNRLHAVVAL